MKRPIIPDVMKPPMAPIKMTSMGEATIDSNEIGDFDQIGLHIYHSTWRIRITNNLIHRNSIGIWMTGDMSNFHAATGNDITLNEIGVKIDSNARSNDIVNNDISRNLVSGLHVDTEARFNEVIDNRFEDNGRRGVFIGHAFFTYFYSNTFLGTGFIIDSIMMTENEIAPNNTMNGKSIIYIRDQNYGNALVPGGKGLA